MEEEERRRQLVGMERLKMLVPEIGEFLEGAGEEEAHHVDVRSLLPKIFKTVRKNGQEEIQKHIREDWREGGERNHGRRSLAEGCFEEREREHVGRRGRARTKTLRKVAKKNCKFDEMMCVVVWSVVGNCV